MIPALNNIDPATAQGILATIALQMMPDPGVGSAANRAPVDSTFRDKLIQELRVQLRLKRDDYSPKAMAKLYAALAEEINSIALRGEDLNEVKARLGHQGLLSPSQYKITFREPLIGDVSRNQVEATIQRPDSYEHLVPEHFGFDAKNAASLFVKVEKPTAHSERYIILVFTSRHGYIHDVNGAWRVYPSDVDLRKSSSPLDVLRAFTETFGTTFAIGEKTGKLFMNEKLPITRPESGKQTVQLFKAIPSTASDLTCFLTTGRAGKDMFESVLSFAIDYKKYTDSLRRHGVNVDLEKLKSWLGIPDEQFPKGPNV